MAIATDPKSDTNTDSDDQFDSDFAEFAAARSGQPLPQEAPEKPVAPDGNDPLDEPPAPASSETATDSGGADETVTSGGATEGGDPAPPPEEKAPDPWASASPELIAARDLLQKERDEANHKAQSDAARVASLSRKLHEFQRLPSAPPAPAEPTEAQKALEGKIKDLKENYGEIAEPLIELIEAQKQELNSVRTTITGLSEERQAQVIEAERQALQSRHPDWQNIAQSTDFAGWLQEQPANIQTLATSWDARETSVVLTLFKSEKGIAITPPAEATPTPVGNAATDAKRSQQLDAGRDVRSRPAPASSGPPEDFDEAFKFFENRRAEKARLAQR